MRKYIATCTILLYVALHLMAASGRSEIAQYHSTTGAVAIQPAIHKPKKNIDAFPLLNNSPASVTDWLFWILSL